MRLMVWLVRFLSLLSLNFSSFILYFVLFFCFFVRRRWVVAIQKEIDGLAKICFVFCFVFIFLIF